MELLDSFHFARPWALILLPIILIQAFWFLKYRHSTNPWATRIRPDLQKYLLLAPEKQPGYTGWIVLAMILSIFALAGPSWSQQSRPVYSKQDALVIVLDMSLSMLAQDIKPDRATRSKLKLMDLLEQRREGLTALVAYAGNAYTVAPLTSDSATIRNLLPALDPTLMPELGSAAEKGIEQAEILMKQAGITQGHILLVTDGIDKTAQQQIKKALGKETRLSILAVGTETGSPIPLGEQGFVKDQQGSVIISKLDLSPLKQVQAETSARLSQLQLDNTDLSHLLDDSIISELKEEKEAELPLWIEQGHWFLLPVLPLAALAFRRGWLLLLPLLLVLPAEPGYAFWGYTPEQKAQQAGEQAFHNQEYDKASQLLNTPAWQGSAYYRNQQYDKAIEAFSQDPSAQGHYNRGNALIKQGQLQQALEAYNQALQLNPEMQDAKDNRTLAEKMLQ
ncbi:VWA domain-containing protein, partial [Oceanospirillum sediminis]